MLFVGAYELRRRAPVADQCRHPSARCLRKRTKKGEEIQALTLVLTNIPRARYPSAPRFRPVTPSVISHCPPRSPPRSPLPLRLLPPLPTATQLRRYSYFALPLRLLHSALSGRCSPFPGNLALTSLFILMSPSPEENIARLKAVLGQKLIPREISYGSEVCVFYGKGDRAIRMSANLLRALGMLWRRTGERLGDRLWLDDGWEEELQGDRGTITEE